jgi:hypothetical protein
VAIKVKSPTHFPGKILPMETERGILASLGIGYFYLRKGVIRPGLIPYLYMHIMETGIKA